MGPIEVKSNVLNDIYVFWETCPYIVAYMVASTAH
jgi:hypothetical protein